MMQSRATLDVEIWDEWGDEGETRCCVCGDLIYTGDEMVYEPSPEIGPNIVQPSHPGCAVRNGYAIRRPGDER